MPGQISVEVNVDEKFARRQNSGDQNTYFGLFFNMVIFFQKSVFLTRENSKQMFIILGPKIEKGLNWKFRIKNDF